MEKMDEDDVIIFSCATITLACALEIQKKPRRNRIRKTWMKDWLRKRDTKGAYVNMSTNTNYLQEFILSSLL